MKMNELGDCVKAVCGFAKRYEKGGMTPLQIFQATGYSEHHAEVTPEVILKELEACPDMIGDWYVWSENNRSTPSWHIFKDEHDGWIVEFFQENGKASHVRTFSDAFTATAFFVKMEMEKFRR